MGSAGCGAPQTAELGLEFTHSSFRLELPCFSLVAERFRCLPGLGFPLAGLGFLLEGFGFLLTALGFSLELCSRHSTRTGPDPTAARPRSRNDSS